VKVAKVIFEVVTVRQKVHVLNGAFRIADFEVEIFLSRISPTIEPILVKQKPGYCSITTLWRKMI